MYSNGSSALKKEYSTYDNKRRKEEKARQKKAAAKKKELYRRRLLKKQIVAFVALISSMAFLVLFRYAAIAREFSELTEKKNELNEITASVVETRMKAEGYSDPKKIEQKAQSLGLQQPEKSQIKYISLGNTDNGEVLKTEETNALSAFINRISVILDYLN